MSATILIFPDPFTRVELLPPPQSRIGLANPQGASKQRLMFVLWRLHAIRVDCCGRHFPTRATWVAVPTPPPPEVANGAPLPCSGLRIAAISSPLQAAAGASSALTLGCRWRTEVSNPRHDLSKFGGAQLREGGPPASSKVDLKLNEDVHTDAAKKSANLHEVCHRDGHLCKLASDATHWCRSSRCAVPNGQNHIRPCHRNKFLTERRCIVASQF